MTASGFSQPSLGKSSTSERSGPLAEQELVQVRFGGTAAQGVILMGVVLAMAATRDHRYVAQTQTHGLEESDVHGHSDVIISDSPVDYPELQKADLLVSLCQGSAEAYAPLLRNGGVFLYDLENVSKPPRLRADVFGIPFARLAREAAGRCERAPDIVALGAVAQLTGAVSVKSLQTALKSMALSVSKEARRRALSVGLTLDPSEWRR